MSSYSRDASLNRIIKVFVRKYEITSSAKKFTEFTLEQCMFLPSVQLLQYTAVQLLLYIIHTSHIELYTFHVQGNEEQFSSYILFQANYLKVSSS